MAAGADIIIAEALLREGAELNVVLPSSIDNFLENSVRPYGESWVPRFKMCLEKSHSCTTLPDTNEGMSPELTILSARIAMGQAILRSEQLGVKPNQLLISDPTRAESFTAIHAEDWKAANLDQLSIDLVKDAKLEKARAVNSRGLPVLISQSTMPTIQKMPSFNSAISHIFETPMNDETMFGLHFDIPNAEKELEAIMNKRLRGTVLLSEAMASYVALKHKLDYKVVFAGAVIDKDGNPIRCYTLQPIS